MKKLYLCFTLVFVISLLDAQTTVTFTIDANGDDAAIDNYNAGNNYPNEIEYNTCGWTISGVPVIWRNLFRFDLTCIPPNATILNADLSLYYAVVNSYGNAPHESLTHPNEAVLQRVISPWTETSATWNNQPSVTSADEVIYPPSISGTQDYLNVDVKNMVQHMVSIPNGNFGFLLKLTDESYYSRLIFASGDNPDQTKHPRLTIKYSIPQTDCITFRLDKICEDAAIDNYNSQNNYPDEIEYNTCAWTISGTAVSWRDYFKFNLPCDLEHANIQSAHLSLFYAAQNNYSNTTHSSLTSSNESVLQRVTSPWTENSITWNNQSSVTSVDEVILPQSTSGTQDYTNIDVTNMVRTMQSNTAQNYGFFLKLTNETYYARLIFASGDNPDSTKHPLLEICYNLLISVDEVENNNAAVFPNPFVNNVNLTLKNGIKNGRFELYNSLGQMAYMSNNLNGDHFLFQNISVSNGLYYFILKEDQKVFATGKLQEMK